MARKYSSEALAILVDELSRLPNIGRVTAQRLAFHILKGPSDRAFSLSDAIRAVKEKVRYCDLCWNITESETCEICHDARRKPETICVVEEPKDVITLESTGEYRGRYHVLHGALSPLDNITPDDIRAQELVAFPWEAIWNTRMKSHSPVPSKDARNCNIKSDSTIFFKNSYESTEQTDHIANHFESYFYGIFLGRYIVYEVYRFSDFHDCFAYRSL